jgi:hypothetical protein
MKKILYNIIFTAKEQSIIEAALYNLANTDAHDGKKYVHKKSKEHGLMAEELIHKINKL